MSGSEELGHEEAVALVAASVTRLFGLVTERQARDLAAAVLRDLAREGVRIVRERQEARSRSA